MSPSRIGGSLTALLLTVTLVACATDALRDSSPPVRLIEEDPESLLNFETLFPTETAFEWSLSDDHEICLWTAESGDSRRVLSADAPAVRVSSRATPVAVTRTVSLDASRVHVIEAVVSRTPGGRLKNNRVKLLWGEGPGSDLGPPMSASSSRHVHGDRHAYRFNVGGHPEWRGTIRLLRLQFRARRGTELVLHAVTGSRWDTTRPLVSDALHRSWKVELDHDVRNALLAPPGSPIEHRLLVGPDRALTFAWGVPDTVHDAVGFRVIAEYAGSRELLFERRLTGDTAGHWHEATVDLGEIAGDEVLLRLETTSENAYDVAQGFPLWANPEVVDVNHHDKRWNLLLISVDDLRADHLSMYGYQRKTTPRLDAWARENAVVFRNVVAPSPWTLPSHTSMLTGLRTFRHGVNHNVGVEAGGPAHGLEMMAKVLRREGYATAAFTGGAFLHPRFGFAQGFDVYGYWPNPRHDENELPTGVERALRWFERPGTGPKFFFLHTYEVHDPHMPRQPYFDQLAPDGVHAPNGWAAVNTPKNRSDTGFKQHNQLVLRTEGPHGAKRPITAGDLPLVQALYDSGIARTDDLVGGLLQRLQHSGLNKRTIVVLTSDHGEALGEDGLAGHIYLYDCNLLIPMVIAIPNGHGAGVEIVDQVRLIDLWPTLADLLGLEHSLDTDGVSLLPLLDGDLSQVPPQAWSYSAAANYGLSLRLRNELKLVLDSNAWHPGGGRVELYDLLLDPGEHRNIWTDHPRGPELRELASAFFTDHAVGLRLRIRNAGPGIMQGTIRGPMVRPVGTKVLDYPDSCLTWREMNRADFEVQAEAKCTVHFEKVLGDHLTLTGNVLRGSSTLAFEHTFSVDDLTQTAAYALVGVQWEAVVAETPAVKTGFELWWHGGRRLQTSSPAEVDDELRERLEALGYLN